MHVDGRGLMIVWTVRKIEIVKYACICVSEPVNVRNGRGREMSRFRMLGQMKFERERRVVLTGTEWKGGRHEIFGMLVLRCYQVRCINALSYLVTLGYPFG